MTQITTAKANKILNAHLFTEYKGRNTLTNMLTDASAPNSFDKNKADPRKQSQRGAPIVRVNDLTKDKGDEVEMDLFYELDGEPAIGDEEIDGKIEGIDKTEWKIKIDQVRKGVSSGGRMTRQRTKHDLVSIAKSLMGPWWSKFDDQVTLVHLSGARGDTNGRRWIVPEATNPRFARMMVNEVSPPTYDRHVIGGDANSFETIDSADIFTLREVDKMRLILDEQDCPIQPIQYRDDPMKGGESDFFLLGVSPRQWANFSASTDAIYGGNAFRQLVAAAHERGSKFKHPLFYGDCAMWNGILIKKLERAIHFNTGSTVDVCQNNTEATATQVTAGTEIERALLIGAQALGFAMGMSGKPSKGGSYFTLHTETKDHGNKQEHSIAAMMGKKKVRFRGSDGRINDFGVMALDTAVTPLN